MIFPGMLALLWVIRPQSSLLRLQRRADVERHLGPAARRDSQYADDYRVALVDRPSFFDEAPPAQDTGGVDPPYGDVTYGHHDSSDTAAGDTGTRSDSDGAALGPRCGAIRLHSWRPTMLLMESPSR